MNMLPDAEQERHWITAGAYSPREVMKAKDIIRKFCFLVAFVLTCIFIFLGYKFFQTDLGSWIKEAYINILTVMLIVCCFVWFYHFALYIVLDSKTIKDVAEFFRRRRKDV